MERLFAVIRTRGPRWDDTRPMEQQEEWPAHAAFMNGLAAEGFVAMGGPLEGTPDVLLIVRASEADAVRARLAADCWSRLDLLRLASVRRWTLRLGEASLDRRSGGSRGPR